MAAGIKQIARDLNLGVSTVAYALAGNGTVSADTRQRVMDYAKQLGYSPNRNARRMRSTHTGVIGLIIPDVLFGPYVEITQHLFRLVESRGNELQIAMTEFNHDLDDRALKNMVASRVDGIIAKACYSKWDEVPRGHGLRMAIKAGIPVVLCSDPIEGSGLPYMLNPSIQGLPLVVKHLCDLGHKRIACLMPASHPLGDFMQRWLAAAKKGLASTAQLQVVTLSSAEANDTGPVGVYREYMNQRNPQIAIALGRQLFRDAMALPEKPTAIIGFNDVLAVGAIFEAQALNLKVGRDIAIAGSSLHLASHICPISLTTVDTRPKNFAEKLLAMLDAQMASADRTGRFDTIEPELIVGQSTQGG